MLHTCTDKQITRTDYWFTGTYEEVTKGINKLLEGPHEVIIRQAIPYDGGTIINVHCTVNH